MNYKEKYVRINLDFIPMAGRLDDTLKAQRRLLTRLTRLKHSEDIKALLVSVAISIEYTEKLLEWTTKMLGGVAEDAKALCEGADVRNQLEWNKELLTEFLNKK